MVDFDREAVMNDTNYKFNTYAEESSYSSKKSWWIIGLLIGLVTNFLAFLMFYVFHKREHFKKVMT
jgi:hypothetical protein